MDEFLPFITGDYSIGLFSNEANDVYHSVYGALTEAYEKFVKPISLINFVKNKNELCVLDICYGIGYNSKILINEILKNKINCKFNIDCIDNDNNLIKISPFIKSKINLLDRIRYKKILNKNIENYKEGFYKNIKYKNNKNIIINKTTNKIILKSILEKYKIHELMDNIKILSKINKNYVFFDTDIIKLVQKLLKSDIYLYQNENNSANLHNIYYRNISERDIFNNFNIQFYDYDARKYLKNCSCKYDIVFLDGFTPAKCPSMWTLDFIIKLADLMRYDGVLMTYNTSVITRNTLLQAGFNIGNINDDNNKLIGTIASKNNNLIINKLSDEEIGLLKTKAGIPYRDINLDLNNEIILYNRKQEVESSELESSSKYLKRVHV